MIGGCAMIKTDSPALPQIDEHQIRLAEDIRLATEAWPQAQWWHRYGDAQLNALIERALKEAPIMAVAQQRLEASKAQTAYSVSTTGLLVGFSASLNRQDLSENGFLGPFAHTIPAQGLTGPWYTEGTMGFSAEYTFDLWGKDRAKVDAALGVQRAHQAETAEVALTLSSKVALTYYDMQSIYAALNLLEQARDLENNMVAAHLARAETGIEARTPTEMVRVHQLGLEQQISAAHSKITILKESLRALTGAGPDNFPEIKPVPLPSDSGALPPTLGYELLARRPDLQAARWYVQASLSQVDMAKAAFYPSFDIKAFFGLDSLHLADLLHRSSTQFNLIPGLSLPIFDGGRLNAALANSRHQSNTLIAQYNQAVVNAVQEVASNGIVLVDLDQQVQLQNARLIAISYKMESAKAHRERGLVDDIVVFESTLPVLEEQARLIELHNRQLTASINLSRALGGGFIQVDTNTSP
ncbi:efflux transporter outer membrane subunit [Solimicrobium silvestre]|nr:efflux transporter outer membrane subunit [Solimicrobium silvestre]